jgi:hypothetical protein
MGLKIKLHKIKFKPNMNNYNNHENENTNIIKNDNITNSDKNDNTTNSDKNDKNDNIKEETMTIEEIRQEQDKELAKNITNIDYCIKITYEGTQFFISFTYKTIRYIIQISGIYLLWILLHYVAAQLYVKFCVPNNIVGFLLSPFMTATPHCQGLRWIIYNAANMINNMWIILGTWICSTILIIQRDNYIDNKR